MLSAIQAIRFGYTPRDSETDTTRFMRRLHFTSLGECVHLRDSIKMNAWDSGYEQASRRETLRFTPHVTLLLKAAQRFNMAAACYREYVNGYRAAQANR